MELFQWRTPRLHWDSANLTSCLTSLLSPFLWGRHNQGLHGFRNIPLRSKLLWYHNSDASGNCFLPTNQILLPVNVTCLKLYVTGRADRQKSWWRPSESKGVPSPLFTFRFKTLLYWDIVALPFAFRDTASIIWMPAFCWFINPGWMRNKAQCWQFFWHTPLAEQARFSRPTSTDNFSFHLHSQMPSLQNVHP